MSKDLKEVRERDRQRERQRQGNISDMGKSKHKGLEIRVGLACSENSEVSSESRCSE